MELLLNAVWLSLSLMALGHWLRGQRRSRPLSVLPLACALMLLFPVISITDDLRADQMTLEDASAVSKRVQKTADATKAMPWDSATTVAMTAPLFSPQWHVVGRLPIASQIVPNNPPARHSSGRAPPCVA